MSFAKALESVLKHEGTYSNRHTDRGGETYKGISRRYHPGWKGWRIVDEAKERIGGVDALKAGDVTPVLGAQEQERLEALVKEFYRAKFWKPIKGDMLDIIDPDIAAEVFDAQVNPTNGLNGACMLQRALVALGYRLKIDCIIGPVTLHALDKAVEKYGKERVLETFRKVRALNYAEHVKKNPDQAVYLVGWLRRALGLA